MPDLRIIDLRCEYLVAPLGIDEPAPRLSWQLSTERRGARQASYRVLVASNPDMLTDGEADRWDSGWVESNSTTHIVYRGRQLESRAVCHWCVEVLDEGGRITRSVPTVWTMGLLKPDDWSARWIAADPKVLERDPGATKPSLTEPGTPVRFRRVFELPEGFRRATLYVTARGVFELRANGRRVGEDYFAPEWTDYDRRIQYRTYDVTLQFAPGSNVLAATLADGWWSGFIGWQETRARYGSLENSMVLQLEVELSDGTTWRLGTDDWWQCNTGPILSSDFQMGEICDARREEDGWDTAPGAAVLGEGIRSWLPVRVVDAPAAPLVAQRSEPIRITRTLAPVSQHQVGQGAWIFDLGQNISGFVRLALARLPAGTRLTIRHGERLNPDGTLYTENLRRAKATDVYISRGSGSSGQPELHQPHFTFHGFQFVEVSGLTEAPRSGLVTGCVLHSATPPAGHFECSHPGINRLWLNSVWSQRDNFISVPTDCPQRDERLGWMGDAQVFLRTASYNMNVAAFFTKWMNDVTDAQTAEGVFPDVAPRIREDLRFVGLDDLCGGAGWADAGVIVPWTLWRVYDDLRIVERNWAAMTRWLDYLERTNPDWLRTRDLHNNYGDWLCIPTDTSFRTHSPMKNLLATAYWADDAAKMARMARALGKPADERRFTSVFNHVRQAFQKEFVRDGGLLTVETQTAYLLALAFDLLPTEARSLAADRLVENTRQLDWHLSTGFIGISHLNPTLTLAGHVDVAYRLLLQETYPSWLYPVKHGATTIWERWNGWTHEDGFFSPQMNSFNHYSLGSVGEWLFRHVAGIELDPEEPGFQRFVLRPYISSGLEHARATYRTLHGQIESGWSASEGLLTWQVRVPANTTARVYIPCTRAGMADTDGLPVVAREEQWVVCEASAGRYEFRSREPGI